MRVVWKKVITYNVNGKPIVTNPLGAGMPVEDSDMFQAIRGMADGIPITLELAANLFNEAMNEAFQSEDCMSSDIQDIGIAKWITRLGYKIILSGNEYEIIN